MYKPDTYAAVVSVMDTTAHQPVVPIPAGLAEPDLALEEARSPAETADTLPVLHPTLTHDASRQKVSTPHSHHLCDPIVAPRLVGQRAVRRRCIAVGYFAGRDLRGIGSLLGRRRGCRRLRCAFLEG